MKKFISIFALSILLLGIVACSPNKTDPPKGNNNSNTTESELEPDLAPESESELEYDPNNIKEFPYIPKHEGMVLQDFHKGENGEFSDATYSLEGVKADTYLTEYKEILVKDGWEVIDESSPEKLSVKKDDKTAIFILSESESGILLMILSK